eukprot:Sspe_Gene.91074::Locus_62540_Transcript_2_2_Confidence_0.750_Length_1474::g.91074::m.91074
MQGGHTHGPTLRRRRGKPEQRSNGLSDGQMEALLQQMREQIVELREESTSSRGHPNEEMYANDEQYGAEGDGEEEGYYEEGVEEYEEYYVEEEEEEEEGPPEGEEGAEMTEEFHAVLEMLSAVSKDQLQQADVVRKLREAMKAAVSPPEEPTVTKRQSKAPHSPPVQRGARSVPRQPAEYVPRQPARPKQAGRQAPPHAAQPAFHQHAAHGSVTQGHRPRHQPQVPQYRDAGSDGRRHLSEQEEALLQETASLQEEIRRQQGVMEEQCREVRRMMAQLSEGEGVMSDMLREIQQDMNESMLESQREGPSRRSQPFSEQQIRRSQAPDLLEERRRRLRGEVGGHRLAPGRHLQRNIFPGEDFGIFGPDNPALRRGLDNAMEESCWDKFRANLKRYSAVGIIVVVLGVRSIMRMVQMFNMPPGGPNAVGKAGEAASGS